MSDPPSESSPLESSRGTLPPHKRVGGRYEVLHLIGKGGMGEVYEARHLTTGRHVALKIIRAADATAELNRRFIREAKTATAIRHPNVIDVLDVFEDEDGTPIMVMELLEGESLAARYRRSGTMSLSEAATVLVPVAVALRAAHKKGIVHRDLKPDNVFLSAGPSGVLLPKVLDFGIAKVLDPTAIGSETKGGQTNTGSLLGTPHYMSYEQAMSEKDIDHRADIWSLGVIAYEALAGQRPMEFENLGQMYSAFFKQDVPSIQRAVPELPAPVVEAIDGCLKKQRAERFDDLTPFIQALVEYVDPAMKATLRSMPTSLPPTGDGSGPRTDESKGPTQNAFAGATARAPNRSRAILWAVAGLTVAGLVGVYALRDSSRTTANGGFTSTASPARASGMQSRETPGSPAPGTGSTLASAPASQDAGATPTTSSAPPAPPEAGVGKPSASPPVAANSSTIKAARSTSPTAGPPATSQPTSQATSQPAVTTTASRQQGIVDQLPY